MCRGVSPQPVKDRGLGRRGEFKSIRVRRRQPCADAASRRPAEPLDDRCGVDPRTPVSPRRWRPRESEREISPMALPSSIGAMAAAPCMGKWQIKNY